MTAPLTNAVPEQTPDDLEPVKAAVVAETHTVKDTVGAMAPSSEQSPAVADATSSEAEQAPAAVDTTALVFEQAPASALEEAPTVADEAVAAPASPEEPQQQQEPAVVNPAVSTTEQTPATVDIKALASEQAPAPALEEAPTAADEVMSAPAAPAEPQQQEPAAPTLADRSEEPKGDQQEAAATPRPLDEKRKDPATGKVLTYDAFLKQYKDQYSGGELETYWAQTCMPLKGSSQGKDGSGAQKRGKPKRKA
jgi:hypothetical protein